MNATLSLWASILSGSLLVLAFPRYDLGWAAWVALVPLLLALEGKGWRSGLLLSQLCGILFNLGIFGWILEVPSYSPLHHALLGVYLGAYFGLFGLGFCLVAGRWGNIPALFAAPFLWVTLEYWKSNFSFLALPWALLAHSQYRCTPVVQVASITGAYGVSLLIILVNSAVAGVVLHVIGHAKRKRMELSRLPSIKATTALVAVAAALSAANLTYGHWVLSTSPETGQRLRVSVVQGNIEQSKKWEHAFAEVIKQTYKDLSLEAAKEGPALIVWPETATPRAIDLDPRLRADLERIARETSAYLVVGSSQQQKFKEEGSHELNYSNSAFLISPGHGSERYQRYDKIRLLPFGEYLPLKGVIPWTHLKVPELIGYTAGTDVEVFRLPESKFGVTICWENIFPDLPREMVRGGAQFIVNITNEAWFGQTAAPYQFLSMSVFRAVENRVYVVRCANTGVSCFIDPFGRVVNRVSDAGGNDIFVRGVSTQLVAPLQAQTVYTRHGDWLALLSILCAAGFLLRAFLRSRVDRPFGYQARAPRERIADGR